MQNTPADTTLSQPIPSWWREWPLVLAIGTLALTLAAKSWMVSLMAHPAGLIMLLAAICGVLLVTSIVTFSQPRTNLLLGCVHLLLFLAYLMLMFEN